MHRKIVLCVAVGSAGILALAGCSKSTSTSTSTSASPSSSGSSAPAGSGPAGSGAAAGSGGTINIGAVFSLTGSAASYGAMAKPGVQLAVDEINAAGGINGKKINISFEDNQLQPSLAATGAQKLLGENIKIIFTHGSSITAAIEKVTAGKDVLLANVAAQSDAVVANPQVYSFIPTNNDELGHMASLMLKRGDKTLAVIHSDDDYGKSASAAVEAAYKKDGGTVVDEESHPPGATDMRTQLIKIRGTNPSAIAVLSNTGEIAHIVQQARQLDIKAELFGADSSLSPSEFTTAGDSYNGYMGVAIRFDPTKNAAAQAFEQKFKASTGQEPNNYAAIAYEAMKQIGEGMKKADGDDPAKIGAYLMTIKNVDGSLGAMTMGADRVIQFPYYDWIIKDGKVTALD